MIDQIKVETSLNQSVSVHSVTTRSIKVKHLAVVNRSIFWDLKSKDWLREIPYNTKPVKSGAVSSSSIIFIKFCNPFSFFDHRRWCLTGKMWFQSSWDSLQAGQVWVSCSLLLNFLFSNPQWLHKSFVSILCWDLDSLFNACLIY